MNDFSTPNAVDTYKNTELNAWVNRKNDEALYSLLQSINNYISSTFDELEEKFLNDVKKSMIKSQIERKSSLNSATKNPEKIIVKTVVYKRNSDVVAEALILANGKCRNCSKNAPFIRKKDCSPYLEVHHIVPPFRRW